MSEIIKKPWEVKTFQTTTRVDDPEAVLSILEFTKMFPEFPDVKRMYYIENKSRKLQFRGGHYHPDKKEILWVIRGECKFILKTSIGEDEILLTEHTPRCLHLNPGVFHELWLEPGTIVAVVSPKHYSADEAREDELYLSYRW